ncbi:MAG: TonB-dependent receptor, partial [Sphingobacteriales bacterium]
YENLNTLDYDRIFGNLTASYALNKKMSLQLRGGTDQSTSFRTFRRPYSSIRFNMGRYQEQTVSSKEQNFDFLYKYDEKLSQNLALTFSVGGSTTYQESKNNNITAERLSYPGIYTLANAKDRPLVVTERIKKQVNSLYGLSQFSYKTYLFLDVTGRNDWSSALPQANNSYFYYSVAGSAVLTEMFNLSAIKPLSFFKLRASVAQVGNDTSPYRTNLYYSNSGFGGSYNNPTTLPGGDNLKPEIITNREFGTDIRLFNSRINLDLTYYNSDSKNQILEVPNDPSTGYQYRIFNAGLINNSGWEVALGGSPLSKGSRLKWKTTITWSTNRSEIRELSPGVESIIMATGPRGYIEARVGGAIGDIYGSGFLRSPDGQIVHDAGGLPIVDTENIKYIGSAVPDWKAGIQNQFTYKNWSFSFLFDGQKGGDIYSFSHSVLAGNGKLKSTLPGRYEGVIGEGVQQNA